MENELIKQTQSIYDEMCELLSNKAEDFEEKYCIFHTCVGHLYEKADKRIVFYGRATNGWDEDDNPGIFTIVKCKRSPFFRLINRIANELFPQNPVESIVWSNVCKVAPRKGGNPSQKCYEAQLPFDGKILRKEMEILSPDVMIFITGIALGKRWDEVFDLESPDNKVLETMQCLDDSECNVEAYQYERPGKPLLVLVTGRPDFKSYSALEYQFNSIMSLIRKYS